MAKVEMRKLAVRNEQARALRIRAGNAGVAVAVDTRVKMIRSRVHYTRKGKQVAREA